MADKLVPHKDDQSVIRKFIDLGGGVWSEQVSLAGGVAGAAGYPGGSTPVAAQAAGANVTLTPTLAGVAGKTTYITSLQIMGCGATGGVATGAVLSGVLGGSISIAFAVPTGSAVGLQPITMNFNPPLPASAPNTAIVLTVPAFGAGNITEAGAVQGFQL